MKDVKMKPSLDLSFPTIPMMFSGFAYDGPVVPYPPMNYDNKPSCCGSGYAIFASESTRIKDTPIQSQPEGQRVQDQPGQSDGHDFSGYSHQALSGVGHILYYKHFRDWGNRNASMAKRYSTLSSRGGTEPERAMERCGQANDGAQPDIPSGTESVLASAPEPANSFFDNDN